MKIKNHKVMVLSVLFSAIAAFMFGFLVRPVVPIGQDERAIRMFLSREHNEDPLNAVSALICASSTWSAAEKQKLCSYLDVYAVSVLADAQGAFECFVSFEGLGSTGMRECLRSKATLLQSLVDQGKYATEPEYTHARRLLERMRKEVDAEKESNANGGGG